MKKITIWVEGMHCKSCELVLEQAIKELPGVKNVTANKSAWKLTIEYIKSNFNEQLAREIITKSGYSFSNENKKQPKNWFSNNTNDYLETLAIFFTVIIAYSIFTNIGLELPNSDKIWTVGFLTILFIGLTAWFSSCMAVLWGLILAISSKWSQQNLDKPVLYRFLPHIYFNLWRIVGFGILGWLLGFIWAWISISSFIFGLITIFIGWVMVLLWVNLIGISPRLSDVSISMPKFLTSSFINPSKTAFVSWFMSFFLPCWFTFAMQMYAISSKSFFSWAIVMSLFALGTLPGILGIWGLTSLIKWNFAKIFFRFAWVVVLLLWLGNIFNSWNLIKPAWNNTKIQTSSTNSNINSNLPVQEVHLTQSSNGYSPQVLKIRPNTKIRLIINSLNNFSCASQFAIPDLWIQKSLEKWENIIEFVSPEAWEIDFSCTMWMYRGKMEVGE